VGDALFSKATCKGSLLVWALLLAGCQVLHASGEDKTYLYVCPCTANHMPGMHRLQCCPCIMMIEACTTVPFSLRGAQLSATLLLCT
jgi:hypothetical protein